MRKIAILSMLIVGFMGDALCATRSAPSRGASSRGGTTTTAPQKTTAARAAVGARAARSATPAPTPTAATIVSRGRSATTPKNGTVAARAGITQKVIGSGTKVAAAAKNIVVSEECQAKYDGCMDAFCMLDNETGGRCLCSDKNAEFDAILAEIEKLDQQSYQMATFGVERIEMGADADAAIASANAAAQSVIKETDSKKSARKALDLSLWDNPIDLDDEGDLFGEEAQSPVEGKEGDALHRAAAQLCVAQIPECAGDLEMLQMMYAQRIKSDCAAYENSLKQQKKSSTQKLATAEKALREAALEQHRNANKYDLGQCTVKFKECMQTTGGCGDDFAGCASVVASDNTNLNKSTSKKQKKYAIKGTITTIEISASTYDALMAKKPLCESITKSCVNVAGQVWDTFLREVAPQVKNAELIAEDRARQDCIGNISSCFQKACKDTMDPNDPDGSYDMCLSRPETMLNLCKIPLNACGIDASSADKAQQSQIWDFVVARLASMRVDACTTAVKECLTDENRCGEDYAGCIGLDTDTIIRMCPYDKLTGCQKIYGEEEIRGDAIYEELATMVQGIMLSIDNNFAVQCQNAANEAMLKVCGDTQNCDAMTVDNGIGARALEYKVCEYSGSEDSLDIDYDKCRTDISQILDSELGRVEGATSAGLGAVTPFAGVIDGTIYWESIDFNEDGTLTTVDEYLAKLDDAKNIPAQQKEKVKSELAVLQRNIDVAIQAIESDPTVQYCMFGREVQGMKRIGDNKEGKSTRTRIGEKSAETARFPELTKQMRMIIATSALKKAKNNYYKKYDELNDKMLQDYAKLGERLAEIQGENSLDVRRELARQSCVGLADMSSLPMSPKPPKSDFAKIATAVVAMAAVAAIPFTGGLSSFALIGSTAITTGTVATATAVAAGTAAALGTASLATNKGKSSTSNKELDLVGSKSLNQWNFKQTITSTFNWETLKCEKCTRSQRCAKTKRPLFGDAWCKEWENETSSCEEIQF